MIESVFLGAAGGLLGLLVAYPLVNGLIGGWVERTLAALIPEFRLPWHFAAGALAGALVVSALVALSPVLRVSRIAIADGIRQVT
jgi:ABC-type antimicrobial peptide transport system permease subunit